MFPGYPQDSHGPHQLLSLSWEHLKELVPSGSEVLVLSMTKLQVSDKGKEKSMGRLCIRISWRLSYSIRAPTGPTFSSWDLSLDDLNPQLWPSIRVNPRDIMWLPKPCKVFPGRNPDVNELKFYHLDSRIEVSSQRVATFPRLKRLSLWPSPQHKFHGFENTHLPNLEYLELSCNPMQEVAPTY